MDIPRYWRLKDQRYRLLGTVCEECGHHSFPPRLVCPNCRSKKQKPFTFSGKGRVFSFTKVYQTIEKYGRQVPYLVALIDLEEGARITAQLTDINDEEVHIGMPVEMVVRKYYEDGKDGPVFYGYKFRPKLNAPEVG